MVPGASCGARAPSTKGSRHSRERHSSGPPSACQRPITQFYAGSLDDQAGGARSAAGTRILPDRGPRVGRREGLRERTGARLSGDRIRAGSARRRTRPDRAGRTVFRVGFSSRARLTGFQVNIRQERPPGGPENTRSCRDGGIISAGHADPPPHGICSSSVGERRRTRFGDHAFRREPGVNCMRQPRGGALATVGGRDFAQHGRKPRPCKPPAGPGADRPSDRPTTRQR